MSNNPINYDDLFDFSDPSNIRKAIQEIENLQRTYVEFFNTVTQKQINDLTSAQKELRASSSELIKSTKELSIAQKDSQSALLQNLKAAEDLKRKTDEYRKAKEDVVKTEKLVADSVDGLNKKLREQIKEFNSLSKSTDDVKLKQLGLDIQNTRKEIAELNSVTKTTKQVFAAAKGSYNELDAETKKLVADLKAMGNAFDENNLKAKELQQKIFDNTRRLKEFDAGINQYFRNVGNYKSGFNQFGNAVNQITREFSAFTFSAQTGFLAISNNLPILFDQIQAVNQQNKELAEQGLKGVSVFKQFAAAIFSLNTLFSIVITLTTVFGKEIGNLITSLFKGSESFDIATERLRTFYKALAGNDFKKAFTDVNQLRINIELAKQGFIDKKEVVDQYNKTIGTTTGIVKNLNEAEQNLNKNANAYIKTTLFKAAANIALEEAARLAYEAQREAAINSNVDIALINQRFDEALKIERERVKNKEELAKIESEIENQRQKEIQKVIDNDTNEFAKQRDAQIKIAEDFQRRAAEISSQSGFSFTSSFQDDKTNPLDKLRKQSDLIRKQSELEISQREALFKAGIIREEDFEADKLQITLNALKKRKSLFKENSAEYIDLQIEEQNAIVDALTNFEKIKEKISDEERRLEEEDDKRNEKRLKEKIQNEIDAETSAYTKRIEANRTFNFGIFKISVVNRKQQLADEIEYLNNLIEIRKRNGEETVDLEKKKEDLISKYALESAEQRKRIVESSIDTIRQGVGAIFEIQNNSIQKEIDAIEIRKQKEIEAVGDNKDAQKRIEERYEKERAKLQRKQALNDRKRALFEIATQTAINAVKLYALTIPPGILSLLAIAQGAIQAGVVLSQPIPQYYTGTENSKEGLAEVAERGPEIIEDRKGNKRLAMKRQITYLEQGSKVYNAQKTAKMLADESLNQKKLIDANANVGNQIQDSIITKQNAERNALANKLTEEGLASKIGKEIKGAIIIEKTQIDRRGEKHYRYEKGMLIEYLNKRNKL